MVGWHVRTAKEQVRKMLDGLPDGVSLENIQYHIYVLATVTRGLEDVEAGRLLTAEDVEQRMSRWLAR